ncbi:MAG: GAF domain-containing protein, partial [Thermodesulfobacteriota bacterium]
MGYSEAVTADRLKETVALLKRQVAEQEARLATYKETLEEIYDLYDTRVEELSLIRRLSDTLRTNLDLKKVCLTIVGLVMEELSPDGCLLCLLEPDGRLRLKASGVLGQRPAFWPEGHDIQNQAPAEGPLIQVVRDRKPILLPEMEPSQGWLHGAASFLGLPLISRQEPVGVFALLGSGPEAFHQETIRLMTIIGDQAAAALYNVRLFNELRKVNRDLRRSERAARLSRSSLERLLENANDLIVTLSRDGLIAYVNRKVR